MSDIQSQLEQNANLTAEGKDQTIKTMFEAAVLIGKNIFGKQPERNLSVSKKAVETQPSFKISKKVDPSLEPVAVKVDPVSLGKAGFESLDRILPRDKQSSLKVKVDGDEYEVTRHKGNMINVTLNDPEKGVTKTTYKNGKSNANGAEISKVLSKMPEIAQAVGQELDRSQTKTADPQVSPKLENPSEPDPNVIEGEFVEPEVSTPEADRDTPPKTATEEPTIPRHTDLEDTLKAKTEELELPKKTALEPELLYGFDDKGEFIEQPLEPEEAQAILALLDGREGEIVPGEAGKNLLIEFGGKTLFETNEKGEITTSAFDDPNVLAEIRKTDEMGLNKLRDYAQRYAKPKQEIKVSRGSEERSQSDVGTVEQQPPDLKPQPPNVDIRSPEAQERSPEAEIRDPEADLRAPEERIRSPEAPSPQIEIEEDYAAGGSFDVDDDDVWIEPDSSMAQSLDRPVTKTPELTVENYLAVLEESVLREELAGKDLNTRVANKDIGGYKFNRNTPNKQDGSYSITMKTDAKSKTEAIGSVSSLGVFTPNPELKHPERIKEIAKAILVERGIELGAQRSPERQGTPNLESEDRDFSEDFNPELENQDFGEDFNPELENQDFGDDLDPELENQDFGEETPQSERKVEERGRE